MGVGHFCTVLLRGKRVMDASLILVRLQSKSESLLYGRVSRYYANMGVIQGIKCPAGSRTKKARFRRSASGK